MEVFSRPSSGSEVSADSGVAFKLHVTEPSLRTQSSHLALSAASPWQCFSGSVGPPVFLVFFLQGSLDRLLS